MWYLTVSIPDLCTLTYFGYFDSNKQQKCFNVGYDNSFTQSDFMHDLIVVFSKNFDFDQNYLNLNATKRPFRHSDVRVGNRENHVICIFKITLHLHTLNIGSPNVNNSKLSKIFIFGVICPF